MGNAWRRTLGGLGIAVVAAVVVSGCSAASGEAGGTDEAGAGPVTIRFVWWGGDERAAATQQVLDDFSAEHPDITVVAEPASFESYWDRLSTDAAGGNMPDVITLASPYTLEYANRGALLPLDDVADVLSTKAFAPQTLAGAEVDGAAYGLPTGGNAIGVVVNPRVFAEAGVDLPDGDDWTWSEFVEIAGAITAGTADGVYGMENRINDTLGVYVTQRGTPMYTEDGTLGPDASTLEDYWETVLELLNGGGMPPADLTQELYTLGPAETLMGQGRAGMTFAFSNLIGTYADASGDDLVLLSPPGESEFQSPGAALQASQYYGVAATSEHPEAAALLIDYLVNSTQAGEIILADRGLPFNSDVLEAITPLLDPSSKVAAAYVQHVTEAGADPAPATPPGGSGLKATSERLDAEVLFGRLTPAQAAQSFVDEMTAALE
ncbi:ABC transporter substrate-binding protein [Microbacterium sp. A84]|uniref:ABC transporter substrate-binding protein n=1 Tax=Microbacterium sp. A84 TaxID=3450715 RepID=UPI003F441981